jgi:hypothetical protein
MLSLGAQVLSTLYEVGRAHTCSVLHRVPVISSGLVSGSNVSLIILPVEKKPFHL